MKIEEIISKMTLKEKASFFSGKDFWQTMDMPKYGISSMFLSDGPNGVRKQAVGADHLGLNESLKATCFPTSSAVSSSWNESLGESLGECLGKEAVALKVNVLLGPGINIKRSPLCGRNFEYFSEDPYLAGKIGAAYVRGIQSNGISACVKHFAVNSQEERRLVSNSVVDERTLREIYLTAFEIVVKEGKTKSIMSSYNKLNGVYANENEHLLKEILRDEWGYKGVIISDWGGNNDRVEALRVGSELEMPTTDGETNIDIVDAVNSGKLDESYVDKALFRLLTLERETKKEYNANSSSFDQKAHHDFARKVAEESIVLLENDGALPLTAKEKVAVIGDFAKNSRFQGGGSSNVNPTQVDNAIDSLKDYPINYIGYAKGFDRYGKKNNSLIKKAVKLASEAETILLYLGLDEVTESEGLDRKNMLIPQNQIILLEALKKLNKKIVVVLSCGSAIEMNWASGCNAVIHGHLGGQAGAKAMLNALVGKVNPSGKLSESYPIHYEDCSSAKYFHANDITAEYRESIFVGYRYYDTANIKVKYPFGYGLSYTSFSYANLTVSAKGVKFTLTNTGKVDGAEVCELYVGASESKLIRAKKELKGFAKVYLKAGESKEVSISFDEYTFRYYNSNANRYEEEPLNYEIMVGASVEDIKLTASYQLKSNDSLAEEVALSPYNTANVKDVSNEDFEKLLGTSLPKSEREFIKKNRMEINYNTTIMELRFSRGWTGRFFAWGIRSAYKILWAFGKRKTANVLVMGMFHQPLRAVSRMSGGIISFGQLDGMIIMFNGHFFKGLKKFFHEGKIKNKRHKEDKRK